MALASPPAATPPSPVQARTQPAQSTPSPAQGNLDLSPWDLRWPERVYPTGVVRNDGLLKRGIDNTIRFLSQHPVPRPHRTEDRQSLQYIWHAVSCEEARDVSTLLNSVPGLDGITAKQWRAVPASVKALFFNIILATGGFAPELLESRTVFIPKKAKSITLADFRPISIA